jgi:enamine deaminase RidA (YjgF/YER057c/UK114 family)
MRTAIFPEDKQATYEAYGYSAAILSNDLLFVSGQVGVDKHGNVIVDPAAQFQQAFDNLGQVLKAVNCSYDNVVDITTFHVDMHKHFDDFAAVKQKVFPNQPYPNWTAVGVVNLAEQSLLLEVKAIARLAR